MEILEKYFAELSDVQRKQFDLLHGLYLEWNAKINVISRKDIHNFYLHHVLHSLAIAAKFTFENNIQVMDLGSGGGFPGLPLAILYPEASFYLVDSINKKLTVANEIAKALGLTNVTIHHTRAEDIKNRQFDAVVSRAVAPLKDLWYWSKPLLQKSKFPSANSPNGLICLKGGDLSKEIFESGCKPFVWEISKIFSQEYFTDKFILYQPIKK